MENKRFENIIRPEVKDRDLLKGVTVYINAGGRGTRLAPILEHDPKTGITKALIELKGVPIVKLLSDKVIREGFGGVIIGAGDHYNVSEYYAGLGENEKTRVVNFDNQLGTGGDLLRTVRGHKDSIGDDVLIQNVDTAVVFDANALLKQHQTTGADATIVLTTRPGVPNEGAFLVDNNGRVLFSKETKDPKYIIEKPSDELVEYRASSTGVIIFKKEALLGFNWDESDGPISIYGQILGKLIKDGNVYAYNNGNGFFMDIGTPENYKKAVEKHPTLFGYMYGEKE